MYVCVWKYVCIGIYIYVCVYNGWRMEREWPGNEQDKWLLNGSQVEVTSYLLICYKYY